ncbi:hypothetical protein [Teredinibacter sp. KSP-S5-2]|uniref:hypothetical protein n=1 Tax=Teredinibacter sp. KSP-S5-2 TaxID=3034506 RepID=UPI002934DD1C|nr:hypothetical protein [Teredinibacter sp. KSP-S5-2]WNO09289.1 hypothetical protein P5V12_20305 [Teredinibacter sp. KSP-S5-2]
MISFFTPRPLIDADTALWISDVFQWAIEHFDGKAFFQQTQLIQPSNAFFPGRVTSVHEKADSIFQHCLTYTGLTHWPFTLTSPEMFSPQEPMRLGVEKIERHTEKALVTQQTESSLVLSYPPQQVAKPGDLAASFAHGLAQHMLAQYHQAPPGGPELFVPAAEVVAIFMGFGVLFSNSAYTFRGGCGSCYNPHANRSAALSEDECLFALAVFCKLKKIPISEAKQYLKPHLKGRLKKGMKQFERMESEVVEGLLQP